MAESAAHGAVGPTPSHGGKIISIGLKGRELVITRYSSAGSYFTESFTLPEDNRPLCALRDDLTKLVTA